MDWNAILNTVLNACVSIAMRLVLAAIILMVGRFVIKFILKKIKNSKKNKNLDPTIQSFVFNILKFTLWTLLAVCIVGTLGVEMASIIALIASAGAAIALAVKGSFSNLVGGIMLLIFKPIGVGEFVEIGGQKGTVQEIGIFYTVLSTADNLTISVPNAKTTDSVVINYSRKDVRRLDLTLDVAYGTDVEKAKAVIAKTLGEQAKALTDPAPFIRLTGMKDFSLEITVRVWCASSDYLTLKSDFLEAIDKAFAAEGIEIPFPQLDVHTK